jgi:hypothetical protein
MSATEIHTHLQELQAERVLASLEGLGADVAYMADLAQEITITRHAFIGAAVTEIATLRGELFGRQQG